MKRWLASLALALSAAGCGGESGVIRVYDGRIVPGRFIGPDAYASFLRGVLAEESGDPKGALDAYRKAADEDDDDPAVWARIGEVTCKADPSDRRADEAFARAERAGTDYAGLHEARARCELVRGRPAIAASAARRAADADPGNVEIGALLVRADAKRNDEAGRARAIALTLAHGDQPAAWDALVAWGHARGDAALVARGLRGLLFTAPTRTRDVERGAVSLLGDGYAVLARGVAAAIADAPRDRGVEGPSDPTVARLAVDEALSRGDEDAAGTRATRGHVPLAEVAARALVLDRRDLALSFARLVAAADPGSSAAQMVLAAATSGAHEQARSFVRVTDEPPALCALLVADRLAAAAGTEVAQSWFLRVRHSKAALHDPLTTNLEVELAARGVLPPSALAPEGRVELAARLRETPPATLVETPLDAKHGLLFLALTEPASARARAVAARLVDAAESDPVVGFAFAKIALAVAGPPKADGALAGARAALDRARRAVASAPANPLLLAAAVELAKRSGAADDAARTRLMAVARTPAERALATE